MSLTAAALPVWGGLIINPTFAPSIANDVNSAAIESTINSAIDIYQASILNPITVNITFQSGAGLGDSQFTDYAVSYPSFYSALQAQAHLSADDMLALARLAADGASGNPVSGSANILIKSALGKALGYGPFPSGPDGVISLNTSLTSPGSPGSSGTYSLLPVVEHEINEILGLGSTLGAVTNPQYSRDPSPEDFFRFDGNNGRSFKFASANAYFSLDGTTNLAQFNNPDSCVTCGDYGDWAGGSGTVRVQDAYATPGSNPDLGLELRALDVIGYDVVATPEPGTFVLFASALVFASVWRTKVR